MKPQAKKVLNVIKKVLWGVLCAIFGLTAFVLVWLSVDKFIVKSPVPSVFGYSALIIETGSMNGTSALVEGGKPKRVDIGDMVIIKDTGDYKIGDVIAFLPEGDKIPTTHRIIGLTENGFITKGDANNTHDTTPIEAKYVLGEVVVHLQRVGVFAEWVKKEGWLYVVSMLAIIAIGGFLLKSSHGDEEEENDSSTDSEEKEKPSENEDSTAPEKEEN